MTYRPILGLCIRDARSNQVLAQRGLEGEWRSPWNERFDPATECALYDVAVGRSTRIKIPGETDERVVYLAAKLAG